ncbi:cytochrome P450, partial [Mycena galopus ATCC 62051]
MGVEIWRDLFGERFKLFHFQGRIFFILLAILKVGPGTAVKELMDKRSGSTVDRSRMHVVDLVTGGLNMAPENWRTLPSTRHLPIPQAEASQLLNDIPRQPEGFYTHIRRYCNSAILSVLYGKHAPRYETPETTAFFNAQREWGLILEPGATPPVDLIPILKYVPERWAKWKRDCAKTLKLQRDLYFGLLGETKVTLSGGDENGSYMEEILTSWVARASDSTAFYLQSLILALVSYPEVQRKAHEEIDRVVGQNRMPTLEDLEEMPYIRAIILETHRFRPVAPLLAPYSTLTAEEYNGFIIPQGPRFSSTFVRGIFHDSELYDDPESFIPDRYLLTENGTKPGVDGSDLRSNLAFGVGRRVVILLSSFSLNAMNLVWAFNFTRHGRGRQSHQITVRSAEKAEIIEREFPEAADTFSKFESGLSA